MVSPFRKALTAWAAMMGLFLIVVIAFAAFGDRTIRRVEAERLLRRGEDLLAADRLDEAVQLLKQAVEVKAEFHPARRLLVETLLRTGRFGEAVEVAKESTQGDPKVDVRDACLLMGRVYSDAGSAREAFAAYEEATKLHPASGEAHYGLARAAEEAGDMARAVNALECVAVLKNRDSSKDYAEAWEGRLERVAKCKVEAAQPDAPALADYRLACALLEVGRWQEAQQALERCASKPDAPADALFRLGVVAEAKGDRAGASALYRQAVAIAPTHRQASKGVLRLSAEP